MFDQKLLFKTMLWSLGLAAFLGVVAVLIADFDVVGRITATAFLTSAAAAFLWQAAARLERNELSIWTAQIGAILFYACALCGIWEIGDAGKMWGTGFICLGCSAVAAGGWALRLKEGYRHTGMTTAIVAIVSAGCWLWAIWIGTDEGKMLMTGFSVAGWGAAAAVCLVELERLPHRHWRLDRHRRRDGWIPADGIPHLGRHLGSMGGKGAHRAGLHYHRRDPCVALLLAIGAEGTDNPRRGGCSHDRHSVTHRHHRDSRNRRRPAHRETRRGCGHCRLDEHDRDGVHHSKPLATIATK